MGHIVNRPLTKTITDVASGHVSTAVYAYDTIGNVTTATVGGTNATSLKTSYQRNSYGDATSVTDPAGNVTDYCFDGSDTCPNSSKLDLLGLPTAIKDAMGHTSLLTYYSTTSLLHTATDPNNQATTYTYCPASAGNGESVRPLR